MPRKFSIVIFAAPDESPEPLQPGKPTFDTPRSLVASRLAPVGDAVITPGAKDVFRRSAERYAAALERKL